METFHDGGKTRDKIDTIRGAMEPVEKEAPGYALLIKVVKPLSEAIGLSALLFRT